MGTPGQLPSPHPDVTDHDMTWAVLVLALQQCGGSVVVAVDDLPGLIGRPDGSFLAVIQEPAEVDGRPAVRFTVE